MTKGAHSCVLCPKQRDKFPVMTQLGNGLTVTTTLAVLLPQLVVLVIE